MPSCGNKGRQVLANGDHAHKVTLRNHLLVRQRDDDPPRREVRHPNVRCGGEGQTVLHPSALLGEGNPKRLQEGQVALLVDVARNAIRSLEDPKLAAQAAMARQPQESGALRQALQMRASMPREAAQASMVGLRQETQDRVGHVQESMNQ